MVIRAATIHRQKSIIEIVDNGIHCRLLSPDVFFQQSEASHLIGVMRNVLSHSANPVQVRCTAVILFYLLIRTFRPSPGPSPGHTLAFTAFFFFFFFHPSFLLTNIQMLKSNKTPTVKKG